jgi:hypothetical protein
MKIIRTILIATFITLLAVVWNCDPVMALYTFVASVIFALLAIVQLYLLITSRKKYE